jgi:methyltransferase (TIGR00027 family)
MNTAASRKAARTAGRRSKSSLTAAKIARGVVFLARDPVHASLLPEGAAESIERLCLEAGILKPWMCRLFEHPTYRRLVERMVDWFGPGELMRLTLRKRFVDDEVRRAIDAGAQQVIIVGAGFDTLGRRVAESFPDVTVVELDAPATARRRQTAGARLDSALPNHHLEAVDLASTTLGRVLHGIDGWNGRRQTAVVAEGVLMYLSASEVSAFLGEIRGNCGEASRLVFSYVTTDQRGRPYFGKLSWLIRASARLAGEPLRWGVAARELGPFFERNGFQLIGPPERFDLRRRYLSPKGIDEPVGQMERFAVVEAVGRSDS